MEQDLLNQKQQQLKQVQSSKDFVGAIDWTPWNDYVVAAQEDFALQQAAAAQQQQTVVLRQMRKQQKRFREQPLWKTYDQLDQQPVLVKVVAPIHVFNTNQQQLLLLRVAYAYDQEGRVLGVVEYHHQQQATTFCNLDLQLIPGIRRSVQIRAVYAKNDNDDLVWYEGPTIPLAP